MSYCRAPIYLYRDSTGSFVSPGHVFYATADGRAHLEALEFLIDRAAHGEVAPAGTWLRLLGELRGGLP